MSFETPVSRRSAVKTIAAATAAAGLIAPAPRRAQAAAPKALSTGQLPNDRRLGKLKDLNGYFPFEPSVTWEGWQERSEAVRRQILVALGLWPMPTKLPIQATIDGKVERDDYTVERVFFESSPGLYVTGSLYRPKTSGPAVKRPAVLCPHGHWANGRFYDHGEEKVKKEISLKAETDPVGGRYPLQARCVQLARMGCVVFLYDMLGNADNQILPPSLIHGFAKQRPDLSSQDRWGLFSAQSELRLLSPCGLQTWNSIRALDWITTLPDVDPQRIGVTGASGGGTQTFLLGCVDPRPAALFPAVMVSTAMQGGCTCENSSLLRVNTGNIEFAALIAPRPLGMTAANDWTVELETKGLPQLKEHFARLGVPGNVVGKYFPFEHNYNKPSRQMMYAFFDRYLHLGVQQPTEERSYQPLTQAEATVWSAEHPMPPAGDDAELKIVRWFDADAQQQLQALSPKDAASLKEYRRVIGGAWDVLIGRALPARGQTTSDERSRIEHDGYHEILGTISLSKQGEEIPGVFIAPENFAGEVVIWLSAKGKSGLYGADGKPAAAVQALLDANRGVLGIDVLYTGEFQTDGTSLAKARSVENPREFAGYTLGYNHPLFSQRVHDVLTAISRFRDLDPVRSIDLVGFGEAGLWAAAAAAQAGDAVRRVAIGTAGYRFASITDIRDPMLVPGAVKYGDVPGLLSLVAPHPLWVSGEGAALPGPAKESYAASGAAGAVTSYSGADEQTAATRWLLG